MRFLKSTFFAVILTSSVLIYLSINRLNTSENSVIEPNVEKNSIYPLVNLKSVKSTFRAYPTKIKTEKIISTDFENQSKKILDLSQRVLKTSDQEKEFKVLLCSDSLINGATHVLISFTKEVFSEGQEEIRMAAVDFLRESLTWTKNPKRTQVISAIEAVLKIGVETLEVDQRTKKSFVGDKVELFSALQQLAPINAESILVASTGKKEREIFEFTRNFYKIGPKYSVPVPVVNVPNNSKEML